MSLSFKLITGKIDVNFNSLNTNFNQMPMNKKEKACTGQERQLGSVVSQDPCQDSSEKTQCRRGMWRPKRVSPEPAGKGQLPGRASALAVSVCPMVR